MTNAELADRVDAIDPKTYAKLCESDISPQQFQTTLERIVGVSISTTQGLCTFAKLPRTCHENPITRSRIPRVC